MPSDTRQLILRGTGAAELLVTLLFGRGLAAQPKPGNIPYRTPYPDIPRIKRTHIYRPIWIRSRIIIATGIDDGDTRYRSCHVHQQKSSPAGG